MLDRPIEAARALASFLSALHVQGPDDLLFGDHNFYRGCPLKERAPITEECMAKMENVIDAEAARDVWESALEAPVWSAPSTWVHGDLNARNILCHEGDLSAIIDFGGLGVGDPACDLMIAWTVFGAAPREAFREALQVDEAMWRRGRGWALSTAVVAWPYYAESNPRFATDCLRTVEATIT